MARNADLSALYAALIASKADQRARLSERTNQSFTGGVGTSPAPAPSAKDIAFSVMRSHGDTSVLRKPVPVAEARKSFGGQLAEGGRQILSGGQWLLDKLERTSAASAGVAASLAGNTKSNPFEAWREGLTQKKYGHFADVAREADIRAGKYTPDEALKYGVSGFIGDVVTDPLTYVGVGAIGHGVRGVGKALKALGVPTPKARTLNPVTQEVKSAAERAEAELADTGATTVGPNAARELNNKLSRKTKESFAAKLRPVAEIDVSPAGGRFQASASGDIVDVRGTATKGKSAAQLEAMLKLGEVQKYLGQVQKFKYPSKSAVRRIAAGDETLPLPYRDVDDPIEMARYNRQLGAFRANKTRKERSLAAYEVAKSLQGKKTLPAIPREEAQGIARRLAVKGREAIAEASNTGEIFRAMRAAGRSDEEIAERLAQSAAQEGKSLRIPVFVKKSRGIDPTTGKRIEGSGKWAVGGDIGVDEFENLLHTQKLAKPVPLTAKGELKTVKEAISETGVVETKVRGRLTYGYQKGGKPRFEATKSSALLADSENLAEDLTRLHVIDPDTDKLISLGAFLSKQGVDVGTLQTGNAQKIVQALTGKSGKTRPNPLFGGQVTEPKWRELVEPERPAPKKVPYSREELKQWIAENASDLPPQTLSYILNGKGKNPKKGPEGILARARQIANQIGPAGGFTKLDDALKAVEEGDVPEAQMQSLMDFLGVSKVSEIRPAVNALTARMTAREEITTRAANEIENAATEIDSAIASARPVDQLLDELNHSDDVVAADAKLTENLDGFERALVDDITRDVIQYQHYRPQNKETFPYVTGRGVPRTEKTPGKGEGVHRNTFNEGAQLRAASLTFSKINKQWEKAKAEALKAGDTPPVRHEYMYQHALPVLKAVEASLRRNNIPVVLGSKASGIPMGLSDILDVLPPEFVSKYVFVFKKALDPTQIMRIGELLINFGSKKIDAQTAADGVYQHLISPRHSTGLASKAADTGQLSWSNFSKYVNSQEGREDIAKEVAAVFMQATPRIMDVANMRAAELSLKVGEHAKRVSTAVIQQAAAVLADPWASVSQKTIAIADAEKMAKPASKAAIKQEGIEQAPIGSEDIAENLVKSNMDQLDGVQMARAAVINARKVNLAYSASPLMRGGKASSVTFDAKIRQAGITAMKDAHAIVEEIAMQSGRSLMYDLGAKAEMALQYRMSRFMFGHIGNPNMRGLLLNRINLASTSSKHIGVQLGAIAQTHSKDEIAEAFLALQEGRAMDTGAFEKLNKVFGDLFGPVPDESGNYINMFTDLGVTAEDINYHGKKFGLLDSVMFPKNATPEQMATHFKEWDIPENRDVLEELNRLHAAVQNAGVMRVLGSDISVRWGVKTPPVGTGENWVKLSNKSGDSLIYRMVDTELYYPEEIARELHILDASLKTLHDPLAKSSVTRFYDGALHAWKAGFTIYRPGHHTRNAVSDGFFNYLDGVKVRHHNAAVSVLHNGRNQYKDWDSLRALQAIGLQPDNGRIVARNKRAKIELTAQQAHKLMYQTGNLPDYRILEDIGFGQEGSDIAVKLRQLSPLKGKAHNVASTVSEVRDHYFRAAHWIHAFEQVKPPRGLKGDAALKYMADEATKRVRKWHPDGSDLTKFEKKIMRRIIPFYSWMRKAIPLVVQATFTRPGKVLVYPKAMYNMAAAMGVDLESYSNPFPTDQLFPSWLADATQGPSFMDSGHYFGIRPGVPTADIMDEFFTTPRGVMKTVGGMITPAIKTPAEFMFDTDVRTGLEIRDTSDWVDRQIPGISHIASLTGKSPSSVIGNPLDGVIDNTQAAQTEQEYNPNASSFSRESLLNLLTGAGVMDMSKPNYIKSAELEEKYRARELYRKMMQGG